MEVTGFISRLRQGARRLRIRETERGREVSNREQEAWGGEVRMPRWLRRVLRRPDAIGDTPDAVHEKRKAQPGRSVAENADRAAVGVLSDLYREGRTKRR